MKGARSQPKCGLCGFALANLRHADPRHEFYHVFRWEQS